ncbi:MAG: hypothetical protein AB7V13_29740 [Pseudorhodoplanes sp.]
MLRNDVMQAIAIGRDRFKRQVAMPTHGPHGSHRRQDNHQRRQPPRDCHWAARVCSRLVCPLRRHKNSCKVEGGKAKQSSCERAVAFPGAVQFLTDRGGALRPLPCSHFFAAQGLHGPQPFFAVPFVDAFFAAHGLHLPAAFFALLALQPLTALQGPHAARASIGIWAARASGSAAVAPSSAFVILRIVV